MAFLSAAQFRQESKLCSGINYWLKARLLEAIPPGQYASFWLGGRATVIVIIKIKPDDDDVDDDPYGDPHELDDDDHDETG